MKLFISYGHPQAEICRKICNKLTARGHQIWFDETNIPHGSDWRAEIVKGIIASEGVLSMIDRHSVREPGVCLDEMGIAIGVRGGNIRYVLLEKQAIADPPASMSTRQWLDMSDWREHEDDQDWFDSKMEFLIQMVESRENREFAGIIEELRKKLPMCHVSTSKQDSLLRQPFIGREWVKDIVDAWLDDPDGSKICFIYGDPGIGKSAFAAHYTHYNGRVAASIFCDYNNTQFNHPRSVIQTLAYLLACRLPDYRIALLDALRHAIDLGMYIESELFDILLAQPLSVGTVDGNRETMCILIDGLDESGDRDRNVLTEVLTKYAERLPKWLRILTLSRKVEIISGLSGEADTIDLTGGLEENKADVRAYFEYCLSARFEGDENYTSLIDRLSEDSGGIFLYATLMADALAKGKMSIEDTESVPDGLNRAFYRWFQWFFPDIKEYEKSWQMPLACIAASPEPIPEEEIKIVFNWTNTKLNKLKHTLEVLFRKDMNDFEKDTLQLSHKYISEWLFSDAAGRYQLDMKDAFREMGEAFLKVYKSNPEKVTAYEAYHLHDYVNTLTSTRAQNLLLDGLLHGIVIRYGDFAKTWSRYETSMRYYILSEEMALAESAEENGFDRLFRYGQSLSREGDIHKLQSKYRKAHELYYKARILLEKIADGRGTLDDLRGLSVIYEKIGGIYEKQRQYWKALELYRKDRDLSERIARERGMLSDLRSLSVSYYKIARIFEKQTRYNEALEMHRESLKLFERISMERGTLDDFWDLSVSYYTIGGIHEKRCRFEEALQMFRKSMELKNKIVAERGTLDDLKGLSVNYYKIAGVYKTQGRYTEALLLYRKDLKLSERIASERGTLDDLRSLSISYEEVGELYERQNRVEKALESYGNALHLYERLASEWGMLDNLPGLSFSRKSVMGIYEKESRNTYALLCHKIDWLKAKNTAKQDVNADLQERYPSDSNGVMDDVEGSLSLKLRQPKIVDYDDASTFACGKEEPNASEVYIPTLMRKPTRHYNICRVCGTKCDSNYKYCIRCGNRLCELKKSNAMPGHGKWDSSKKQYGQAYVDGFSAPCGSLGNSLNYNQRTSVTHDEEFSEFPDNYAPVIISKVHFSAIAPRTLTKGEYAIIDIVMYQDEFRSVVDEIIKKAETPPQETRSGAVRTREGAKVKIQLTSPDIVIENNVEEQEWVGDYLIYNFAVMLPKNYAKGQALFMATVYIDDLIATRLKFVTKSWSLRQQRIKVRQENVLSAFVSYASQDRNRVALIVQGMRKARPDMDIFFDVESLRSGESWEDALWTEIDQRDTFFLCWSRNAAESPWVSREWKYCYKQKGAEAIEPIPLEPPSICPPPEELKRKHFNDRLLYLIKVESEKNYYR